MVIEPDVSAPPPPEAVPPGAPRAVPEISVVVPIYNERENVEPLHDALTWSLQSIGRPYEIVLVDDGSRDGTRDVLRSLTFHASGDGSTVTLVPGRRFELESFLQRAFRLPRACDWVRIEARAERAPAGEAVTAR